MLSCSGLAWHDQRLKWGGESAWNNKSDFYTFVRSHIRATSPKAVLNTQVPSTGYLSFDIVML